MTERWKKCSHSSARHSRPNDAKEEAVKEHHVHERITHREQPLKEMRDRKLPEKKLTRLIALDKEKESAKLGASCAQEEQKERVFFE